MSLISSPSINQDLAIGLSLPSDWVLPRQGQPVSPFSVSSFRHCPLPALPQFSFTPQATPS